MKGKNDGLISKLENRQGNRREGAEAMEKHRKIVHRGKIWGSCLQGGLPERNGIKMRKQIAVFLSLILIVNMLAIPAGAANLDESSQATTTESVPEKVALKSNGDNTYTLVGPAQNISVMSRSNDLVYAEPIHTWDMELLALSNGGCLSKIGEDLYVAATQVKLDTKDFSKNYPLFEQFDIGEETIQSAKESIESQLEIGNDE